MFAAALLLCGLLAGLIVGSMLARGRDLERQAERHLALSVALLGHWTSGDHQQASEDVQHLALATVRSMRNHIRAGTSPLTDVAEFTGTMKDAGAAMGHAPTPASWTREPEPAPAKEAA